MIDAEQLLSQIEKFGKVADQFSEAKSNRVYLEKHLKCVKAEKMKLSQGKTVDAREADAYTSEEYTVALAGLAEAVKVEAQLGWKRQALEALIEIWRTDRADKRFQQDRV